MFARIAALSATVTLTAWLLCSGTAHANLVSYWNFDSGFNATVGGPTYDATPFNGASISNVASKWGGGAVHFDKALSQYATTAASPVPNNSYSYSLWFYLDLADLGADQYAGFGTGGPGDAYTAFFNIAGAGPGNSDDLLVVRAQNGSPILPPNIVYDLPNPTDHQQWKNLIVTATYDSVANTTQLQAFLNGTSIGTSDAVVGQPQPSTFAAFGVDRGLAGRFWEGYIDDVAVYDHVLSANEIAALQTGPAVVPEPAGFLLAALGLIGLLTNVVRKRK